MTLLQKLSLLPLAICGLCIGACSINGQQGNGDDNYFSAFTTFRGAKWDYAEPVTFSVDTLRDSISRKGDIVLTLRHTNGYPFSNLWLEISSEKDDSILRTDTLNIMLADIYGAWLGHGSGPSIQVVDTVLRDTELAIHTNFRVRHIMRVDTLQGIEQLGISFFEN